jgi:hypothetical protein
MWPVALAIVDELDIAILEFANHRFDVAHLEVDEGALSPYGQAQCAWP